MRKRQSNSGVLRVCRFATSAVLLLTVTLAFAADRGKNGKIAFISARSGSFQIYTINPDGTDLFQVTNVPTQTDGLALLFDYSPDGKQIVFDADNTGALELYVINSDGTGLKQITHDGFAAAPHYSPDGKHIVYTTASPYGLGVITTIGLDGSNERQLSTPFWDSLGSEYTQDGKHIIFSTQTGGLVSALWIMDTDGKNQRRLSPVSLEAGPTPDISPDGKEVVFYNHQDTPKPSAIVKMNIDGTHIQRLTSPGHLDSFSAFSPDGKKIVFTTDRHSPTLDTFIMDADGSNQHLLIEGALAPNWGVQPKD
jgi:Tol biopolymer transport system component